MDIFNIAKSSVQMKALRLVLLILLPANLLAQDKSTNDVVVDIKVVRVTKKASEDFSTLFASPQVHAVVLGSSELKHVSDLIAKRKGQIVFEQKQVKLHPGLEMFLKNMEHLSFATPPQAGGREQGAATNSFDLGTSLRLMASRVSTNKNCELTSDITVGTLLGTSENGAPVVQTQRSKSKMPLNAGESVFARPSEPVILSESRSHIRNKQSGVSEDDWVVTIITINSNP